MTEDLLPCPFCGSDKVTFEPVKLRMAGSWARAVCQGCYANLQHCREIVAH